MGIDTRVPCQEALTPAVTSYGTPWLRSGRSSVCPWNLRINENDASSYSVPLVSVGHQACETKKKNPSR